MDATAGLGPEEKLEAQEFWKFLAELDPSKKENLLWFLRGVCVMLQKSHA